MRIVTLSILVEDVYVSKIEYHMKMMMSDNAGANICSMGAFLARQKEDRGHDLIIDSKIETVPATNDKVTYVTKLK